MKALTVKTLKKILCDVPDETIIVTSSSDHGYRLVQAELTTAMYKKADWYDDEYYCEDFGEENDPVTAKLRRIEILVLC